MKKTKKRQESFLQKHYSLSWLYIKESRNYILFIVLIFLLGFLISLNYKPTEIVELIKSFVERLMEETEGLSTWEMVIYILNNNLKNSFISVLLGVFVGIFPFLTALINGYVLGFVVEKSMQVEGVGVLWLLLPHGIFEFPAVILALALGIKLGFFWSNKKRNGLKKEFLRRFENSLRVFLFIILPLLVIAAIIEGILISLVG